MQPQYRMIITWATTSSDQFPLPFSFIKKKGGEKVKKKKAVKSVPLGGGFSKA